MLVFEVFLLSMMVVLLLNDDDDPYKGYPAKLGNYPFVLKLTHRHCMWKYREDLVPITGDRGGSEYDVTAARRQKHTVYTQLTKRTW